MHILHVDSELTWRGGENQIRILMEGLRARGISCSLAAPQNSAIAQKIGKSCPTLVLDRGPLSFFKNARRIKQWTRLHGVDIVDCHSAHAHSYAYAAALIGMKSPIVVHRRVDYPLKMHIWNALKYRSKNIWKYIAISQAIARVLESSGIAKGRIAVARSAVEAPSAIPSRIESRQKLSREFSISSEDPWIINTAALTEQKDHRTMLQALALLHQKGVKFVALIAGEGKLRNSLESLCSQLELPRSRVLFLGFRNDIPQLLAAGDLFLLTSQDEGLGTALLDASLARIPIVATRAGGIPEIILHNETGLLANVGAANEIAQFLQELIESPERREALKNRAFEFVNKNFSPQRMVEENLSVYHEINKTLNPPK